MDAPRVVLEDELVPLTVASTIAYFHVTDALRQVSSREDLAQIVQMVAIALSTVAPIRRVDGRVLAHRDLERELYSGKGELELLSIRRGDLRVAMTSLKDAKVAFGRR